MLPGAVLKHLTDSPIQKADRQPNNVPVIALYAFYKKRRLGLDGVGSGLIQRIAAFCQERDLRFIHSRKFYASRFKFRVDISIPDERDTGQHLMPPTRQQPEHPAGI